MKRHLLIPLILFTCIISSFASDYKISGKNWRADIDADCGTISKYQFLVAGKWVNVPFRNDEKGGFSFEGIDVIPAAEKNTFIGKSQNIVYKIKYIPQLDNLMVECSVTNCSSSDFTPRRIRLTVGVDSEMHTYPSWNDKYFPTLLRCEKSFAWGYFMSPLGNILALGTEEPVASYTHNYIFEENKEWTWGHQIKTSSLDLIHKLPLPLRHPHNLTCIPKGKTMTWHIHIGALNRLEDIKRTLAVWTGSPMVELERYTIAAGEGINAQIISPAHIKSIALYSPENNPVSSFVPSKIKLFSKKSDGRDSGNDGATNIYYCNDLEDCIRGLSHIGLYRLRIVNENSQMAEATFYIRHPWSWYIKQARNSVVASPPYMGLSCETFYGYYPSFIAARVFPDKEKDNMLLKRFERDAFLMIDTITGIPREAAMPKRIQNFSSMIGMYVEMWKATANISYLRIASRIADYLSSPAVQWKDGSYRSGKVDYTAVIYPVKSMIELSLAEKSLPDDEWQQRYTRHWSSASAAAAYLEKHLDNIETEGDMTFEDGMISCSALQMGMMGVFASDKKTSGKMKNGAAFMLDKHRCLEQLLIPDCRMRGATLRYWEALDLYFSPNQVMNSPHGWSAWKIYAEYYLYQLTGDEHYLNDMMNSLGAGAQVMRKDGFLRWGFMPDPYLEALVCVPKDDNPHDWQKADSIVGEQYMNMISPWLRPDKDEGLHHFGSRGGAGDNTVYEIFRAIGECALTSAYVVLHEDGSLQAYNCYAKRRGACIDITPVEDCIERVSINFKRSSKYNIRFSGKKKVSGKFCGIKWIELEHDGL